MVLNNIDFDIDFSSSLLTEIKDVKQNNDKKRALDVNKKLNKEHKDLAKKVKIKVNEKIKNINEEYKKQKLELDEKYHTKLNETNNKEDKKLLNIKYKRLLKQQLVYFKMRMK